MDPREARALELVKRAEALGLHLTFDQGFIVAKRAATSDPARQGEIIAELAQRLDDVRSLVIRRSKADRGKAFVGRRIWTKDGFNLSEGGEGVLSGELSDVQIDGSVIIAIKQEGYRHPNMVTATAESLLVVVDDVVVDEESAQAGPVTEAQPPRKRILGVF